MVDGIRFGALVPSLSEQLGNSDYDLEEIKRCQRFADAISDLWIASLLTDSQVTTARTKLGKRIFKAVKES